MENRRETFRQDEHLAIKEEFLTPEQFSAEMTKTGIDLQQASMAEQLMNSEIHSATHDNPEAMKAMQALELKLNYLITMNMHKDDEAEYPPRLVNLSSSGMGFITEELCDKGDHLKVKITLPLFPPVKLELLGEIVSVSPRDEIRNKMRIGVSFIYRSRQEQDTIVKYLFKRQRENLRDKA